MAQSCITSPAFTPAAGDTIIYKTTTVNTGDLTINVNASSAVHVRKWQASAVLASGDLVSGVYVPLTYDGTYWETPVIGNPPSGGAGGTINSGATFWMPWGADSYAPTGAAVGAPVASKQGARFPLTVPAQIQSTYLVLDINAASGTAAPCVGSTCGFYACIYKASMTSYVACTATAVSGGASNINATGATRFAWSTGSAVSGGVLTLPPGNYYVVTVSDSTALKLQVYGDGGFANMANVGGASGYVSYASANLATGNGASLAPIADISTATGGVTWIYWNATNLPLLGLLN